MLQIRRGIFETNSSSCNKLIVPYEQSFRVPRIVMIDDDSWVTDGERYLSYAVQRNPYAWIPFLLGNGVEEIKYTGRNEQVIKTLEEEKQKDHSNYQPAPTLGSGYGSRGRLPAELVLSTVFGEDTKFLLDVYDDLKEPEETDGKHFVWTWSVDE